MRKDKQKIENLIDDYESFVHQGLDYEPNYETEALLALIVRDDLEDQWGEMGERERRRVFELDDVLVPKRERVAVPGVLPSPNEKDRRRWWWFLHEGPEVGERDAGGPRGGETG